MPSAMISAEVQYPASRASALTACTRVVLPMPGRPATAWRELRLLPMVVSSTCRSRCRPTNRLSGAASASARSVAWKKGEERRL
jgi:hypothetical protein